MSSKTAICNRALINLGQAPISSIDEEGPVSNALNQIYNPIRKGLLRSHPWNFAMKLNQPNEMVDAPLFKWGHSYQLPNDCLRIWTISCAQYKWKRFADKIYTDDSSVNLIYISDVTDTEKFDSVFEDCLALSLAIESVFYFSGSTSLLGDLRQRFKDRLNEAKLWDAQEEPLQLITGESVLDSRYI